MIVNLATKKQIPKKYQKGGSGGGVGLGEAIKDCQHYSWKWRRIWYYFPHVPPK
jgi:hypothetical protein